MLVHPLSGATWDVFWRLYRENGPYSRRSLPSRLCSILLMLLRSPSARLERWRFGGPVRRHVLESPPVFIIGHWRSGTTHLHNLLSLDPRFAFLTMLQTAQPNQFLGVTRPEHALFNALLPQTRGFDNMVLTADSPQEEEMALGILSGMSSYNCFYFPRHGERHFRQSLLLEHLPPGLLESFKEAYLHLVKKVSFANGGHRQVLFKNPASTCRIPLLLEIFPNARFIHIVRDPHVVFHSMQRLVRSLTADLAWQDSKEVDHQESTLLGYEHVMRRYLEDRSQVPAGNLVEVRYEELDRAPVETVASIYDALGFPGREEARDRVDRYCASIAGYEKNRHPSDPVTRALVADRWRFAFDAFGYPT